MPRFDVPPPAALCAKKHFSPFLSHEEGRGKICIPLFLSCCHVKPRSSQRETRNMDSLVGMINSSKLPPPPGYGTGSEVGGTGSISLVFSSARKPSLLLLRFYACMRFRRGRRRRRDRRDFSLQSEINEMPTERGGFADDLEVCLM